MENRKNFNKDNKANESKRLKVPSEGEVRKVDEEKKYWNKLYLIVFLFLLLQVVFYYFITEHFQ